MCEIVLTDTTAMLTRVLCFLFLSKFYVSTVVFTRVQVNNMTRTSAPEFILIKQNMPSVNTPSEQCCGISNQSEY